jgi:hypothetical protein
MDIADRMRARRSSPTSADGVRPQPVATRRPIEVPVQPHGLRIKIEPSNDGKSVVLSLSGVIGNGDAERVRAALGEIRTDYPDATGGAVFLNSPGGSLAEAAVISSLGASGIPIVVPKNALCASACFLIFASAANKFASPAARIGVHSVVDGVTGQETDGAKAVTTELARACSERGVPPSIIGRMVTTPPGQVAWLTEAELISMGVRMIPPKFDD